MPATSGSTTRLRALREKREAQEAKKQVPLKMRTRKQPVRAKACAKSKTKTPVAKASPKASKAVKQAPKRCGKRKSMDQAGDAEAQAVPSRGLQDATQTSTPPQAEPANDQDKASSEQKAASGQPQQQTDVKPAAASAVPSKRPKQEDKNIAAPEDKAAAASSIPQGSAASEGSAAAVSAVPVSTAAPSVVPGNPSSSAQQAPIPAAHPFMPHLPLPPFGAGPPPGTCAVHVSDISSSNPRSCVLICESQLGRSAVLDSRDPTTVAPC